MSIKQLNEVLFAAKYSVGSREHCDCVNCTFYADNIIKNTTLISFLASKGIDPQKPDGAWCYTEENGYKYYSVDFSGLYSDVEGTFSFGKVDIVISPISHASPGQPDYVMDLEGALKID
ncbi:MAG: hypothetical protein ABS948_04485 [Solibacillus sp.]